VFSVCVRKGRSRVECRGEEKGGRRSKQTGLKERLVSKAAAQLLICDHNRDHWIRAVYAEHGEARCTKARQEKKTGRRRGDDRDEVKRKGQTKNLRKKRMLQRSRQRTQQTR
jgi:hypothetical protein